MILVIAEKPSVARDIGNVLGCKKKGEGYIYSDKYAVSWAVGHLVTLFDPEDYDPNLKKWAVNTLPIIPKEIKLKPIKKVEDQLTILRKLMNSEKTDSIICATDSGREGELIFRYVYDICKCKKPFKRLWISSMTDKAIKDGLDSLKDGTEYDNLYMSAKCRSEADWLVGINASRAFTLKYNTLLSIGRVQTPTLAIIVNRQIEINAFVPDDFWEVNAFFEGYKGLWIKENESRINTLKEAEDIVNKVKNKIGTVLSIDDEEKKVAPELLYDLTTLQRECNSKFGFSATKTLEIAQNLYEKRKAITYPRTDSRYLSDDMIPKITDTLSKITIYKENAAYVLGLPKLPITKRIVNNEKISDHHAIIPTEVSINVKSLSGDEEKVYDLVVRRFISVFYPYYVYNITKIITDVEGETFITKGNTVIELGWRELYKNDKKEDDEENTELPRVKKDDKLPVVNVEHKKKKTIAPKAYTENTLLGAMENAGKFVEDEALKEQLKESGLGTPATRAATIERLLAVGYITRNKKALIPTEKGMKLIEVVPFEMKSPETTGKWEKGLSGISKGKMEGVKFMGSINRYVQYLVNESKKPSNNVVFPEEAKKPGQTSNLKSFGKCPSCGNGEIHENSKGYYCSRWKFDCKFTIWKNALEKQGIELTGTIIKKLIKDKKVENIKSGTLILKNETGLIEYVEN